MVLNRDNEPIAKKTLIGAAVTSAPMCTVAPVQAKRVCQQLWKLFPRSIVLVISLSLAGEGRMHMMMKVIAPLRVEPITSLSWRTQQTDIVQVAFGYDVDVTPAFPRSCVSRCLNVSQNMPSPEIVDGMHGIEAETVEAILSDPHADIIQNEFTDRVTAAAIIVHGQAPGGPVLVGEVRPIFSEIAAFWSDMVVDHVQEHGETVHVARVHQTLQPVR